MQMLINAANKRHTLLFTRWENHSFQFCREKIWISATVTLLKYWSRTAEQYSVISSISGRIHGSRRRIWIQTEDCVPSFVTLPRTKQVFVTKIISINPQIHAYRWCEYAFWHCPVIKRSGAVDTLLISIVESNNGVIFTPDIQRRCQNCWQTVQQCGDVAL